ncbi:MAG: cellulase family glycosylhydrolase [Anaerolineae bacterium]|nr:cellulase family glycosylhydrolase [Anaerolineae bacterium]
MGQTNLGIQGDNITINGKLTYADIPGTRPESHGLFMNARFIQGIFDDKAVPQRFSRFGFEWDASANTERLKQSLPEWKRFGLLGFTVGLQGGMPVLTIPNHTINNNPYSEDGSKIDSAYLERLDKLIQAADQLGMVVIVSMLYQGQANRMADGRCIRNAVAACSRFLKEAAYTNVIIEVANEYNVGNFKNHPIVYYPEGIVSLIDLARDESGDMPVGSSGGGLHFSPEVCRASDVILVHGNGATEQTYYNMIRDIKALALNRPIICNEDSPRFTQLKVAGRTHTSWGYYNNHTKQEPPVDWSITQGEDQFFAWRMANLVGIDIPEIPVDQLFYLQGLEPNTSTQGKRWIRLASLYPEHIDMVEFYRNGELFDIAFEEPFYTLHRQTWIQEGIEICNKKENWHAVAYLHSGKVVEKTAVVP